MGNPRPVFLTRGLEVKAVSSLQAWGCSFWVTDGAATYEAVWNERAGSLPSLQKGTKINLAYSVKTKVWNGIESLALEVKEITL